jgi:predicted MFS family arabinose efflux permease
VTTAAGPSARRYELIVLITLACVNGFVALDRLAVNFLSPYIIDELGLNNAQLGLLSSALSVAIAVSGLLCAALADATGRQRQLLIAMLIVLSVVSSGSGLAASFGGLFLARLVLGVAEGPIVPLTQTMINAASPPERRGVNMGIMQIGGAFSIGAIFGPVITVAIANGIGWRATFFATALPSIVAAIIITLFIRDLPKTENGPVRARLSGAASEVLALLKSRNLVLSMAIAALFTAWLTVQNVFMPRYLTETLGYSRVTMGNILGVTGIGGLIGGVLIPALSDRFGRKKLTVIAGYCSVLTPLALLFAGHNQALLTALLVIGWLTIGCAPLVCAIIPSESVDPGRITTAVALSMGTAELLGGVLTPPLTGMAADAWGLSAVFYIDIALALACGTLALALRETRGSKGDQSDM